MTTLNTILDCPFPMVRAIGLSDYRREQILGLLNSITTTPYFRNDIVTAQKWDHLLEAMSGQEGSPKYYFSNGKRNVAMDIRGFLQNNVIEEFRKVEHLEKMTNLGHPTDFHSFTDTSFPCFRVITDLFSDNKGDVCVAEVAFIPVIVGKVPQHFFEINSDFNDPTQLFSRKTIELWEHLEEMCKQGEKLEVYTNAISDEIFFRAVWTDPVNGDIHSAIVSPVRVFPSGSFSIYTEEK